MATITFKGMTINTSGRLPSMGKQAPHFKLTGADLADVGLDHFGGKKKVISIVPSLDTGVCAASARKFNVEMAGKKDAVLINISADLPFAQQRFCGSENLANIVTLSTMRSPDFGIDYGVKIMDGPLAGLLARAVLVLDSDNNILYTELVPEIAQEPNYKNALAALAGSK